ncbi:hypothetical protein OE766_04940 [Pararhizobium sp. YC-54]|uniref:hypothetical protein n=1 Tax=Pararhizobium sp. YC-54 TaxID=2986920 RepID=UPI0021F754AE|nr:hypothetical protein [Pararhizobium sp. YC-54]MCV9997584.1 hypothetical protein [Pararhizobium sp. YC-54]
MDRVALHLQVTARKKDEANECDVFGRSAYNRYYYATFLCVRNMMAEINPQWASLAHASYPGALSGSVVELLKKGKRRVLRAGDMKLVTQCEVAIHAALEISRIMQTGNTARKIADYNPEIKIKILGNDRFSLNEISITDVHEGYSKTNNYADLITRTWRQLNA